MKPTTPSIEDWRKTFVDIYGTLNLNENLDCAKVINFISELLKSRDNALVEEIEKLKEYNSDPYWLGYNEALDTIIRIIQEK